MVFGGMAQRLDPTLDVTFKLLFRQETDILTALLAAVLQPAKAIKNVSVLNPDIDDKEKPDDKGVLLDILVDPEDGRQIDVEMQTEKRPGMRRRALYYWARMFGGQLRRGQQYHELHQSIVVFFLDYKAFDWTSYHSVFRVMEATKKRVFSEALELHSIELPKLGSMSAEEIAREQVLANWGTFFTSSDPEQLWSVCQEDPMIEKAEKKLEELSADPKAQMLARERRRALDCYNIDIWAAKDEGRAEGRAEGHAEGRTEGAARSILLVLEKRRIPVPDEMLERILACRDIGILDEWLERAMRASCAEEIFAP